MAPKLIVEQKKIFTPQNLTPLWAVQKKKISLPKQKTLKSFHKKVINRDFFLIIIIFLIQSMGYHNLAPLWQCINKNAHF